MKQHITLLVIFFSMSFTCFSKQTTIENIIKSVSIDSLLKTVSEFTGEEDVYINGLQCKIKTRSIKPDSSYTYLAEEYLIQKLTQIGYKAKADTFNIYNYKVHTSDNVYRHIYAEKKGSLYPDKYIYFCAHLDCVGDFKYHNYGADDNASGTAAVLEAARIFADLDTKYSIVFMLFNSEEYGNGVCHFDTDSLKRKDILCAFNIDMIAYDGNNDNKTLLFYYLDEAQTMLDKVENINSEYNTGRFLQRKKSFAGDDARFAYYDVPCISFVEDAGMYDDLNPGYHSNKDRMQYFNNDYYLNNVRLAIAALGEFALNENSLSVKNKITDLKYKLYPNPASSYIKIDCNNIGGIPESIEVFDMFGNQIKGLNINYDNSLIFINTSNLLQGSYSVRIGKGKSYETQSFVIIR